MPENTTQPTRERALEQKLATILSDPAFGWIKALALRFPKAEVYLVGGALRDAAMGRTDQKDYDFVIRHIATDLLEKFLAAHGHVDFVGKTFGVFKFYPKNSTNPDAIDIALPRTDHAFGTGGYKAVEVKTRETLPIEQDLERRDFTMNAMAWDVKSKHLIDPFHGLKDIEDSVLRAVGDPRVRFQEDYSRMLRALRFACQLHSTIDTATWRALQELMTHVNDIVNEERVVPHEIIARELLKSFVTNPTLAFDLYETSGAFAVLLPEILAMKNCLHQSDFHSEGDVWMHTRLALEKLDDPKFKTEFPDARNRALVVIGTLLHDIGKPQTVKVLTEGPHSGMLAYYGHDKIGAETAATICRRLKLSSLSKEGGLHVGCDDLHWIVANHLLILNAKIDEMRASTIERYFFNDRVPGQDLLAVVLADSLATIPKDGSQDLSRFHEMQKRIEEIRAVQGERRGRYRDLPAPLLSGEDIMGAFNLEPGNKIGKLLRLVREQQLQGELKNKADAIAFLRKILQI